MPRIVINPIDIIGGVTDVITEICMWFLPEVCNPLNPGTPVTPLVPQDDGTEKPKDPQTPKPPPPPNINTNPTPVIKLPPQPKPIYTVPLPTPTGIPMPLPPVRRLPTVVDTGQTSHTFTSSVSQSIANRKYGCLLYTPLVSAPYKVYQCDITPLIENFGDKQETAIKRAVAWLIHKIGKPIDELINNPKIAPFIDLLGIDTSIEQFLVDKFCDLAFAGLVLVTRGGVSSVAAREYFMVGCKAISDIALSYLVRNQTTLGGYPLIFNTYLNFEVIQCPPLVGSPPQNTLPRELELDDCPEWEPPPVLLPDPSAFKNKGYYLILFWVLESNPSYTVYNTQTQIPSPKQEIINVIDEEGVIDQDLCSTIWDTYFEPLTRVIGYQYSRLYCQEFKEPILSGNFENKEDAEQYFANALAATNLTLRERAPIVHSTATQEEYLKELSHSGERLILRKVNLVYKAPWVDSAKTLVSFKK